MIYLKRELISPTIADLGKKKVNITTDYSKNFLKHYIFFIIVEFGFHLNNIPILMSCSLKTLTQSRLAVKLRNREQRTEQGLSSSNIS